MLSWIRKLYNNIKMRCTSKASRILPPAFSIKDKLILWSLLVISICSLFYIIDQKCFQLYFSSSNCGAYIAFSVLLVAFLIDRVIRHKFFLHEERREDPSEIYALFVEVDTVERRLTVPEERPKDYAQKEKQLKGEMGQLKDFGELGWTEYRVLSLNQMLVDFLKIDQLIMRAQSSLEDLQEYNDDRYDEKHYDEWKQRVNDSTKMIEEIRKLELKKSSPDLLKIDDAAEMLRAVLSTLLEHVADYDRYWAEGKAIVNNLKKYLVVAILLLVPMSLIPLWCCTSCGGNLSIFNWGLLGIVGSFACVLMSFYKSDYVDVGSTKGKEVLSRSIIGTGLGFLAGIILYSLICGGILDGMLFPDIPSQGSKLNDIDIYRSIFWAITSGFSFECIFGYLENKAKNTMSNG